MDKLKVGILGATGLVGQRYIQFLNNHKFFEISCLMASEKSAGKKYKDVAKWYLDFDMPEEIKDIIVEEINEENIKKFKLDLVFSAVPGEIAFYEEKFAKYIPVFSKVSKHRLDKDVPLIVPEINSDHLKILEFQKKNRNFNGFIVTAPNCSTTGMVLPLKVLQDNFEIEELHVITFQALSGAGYDGVKSMQILDNVIPFISGEEKKMETEALKILGKYNENEHKIENANFKIYASCNRVNVLDGHLEVLHIKLKNDFDIDEIKDKFRNFNPLKNFDLPSSPKNPIIVMNEEDRPQPRLDRNKENGMAIITGRFEKKNKFLRFYTLSHNTIRGAAGESVL
ncbi:MAG: aspartate-semialdehyde dehydrogenase, partial [Candidatus Altarchaeaceae archaeon]